MSISVIGGRTVFTKLALMIKRFEGDLKSCKSDSDKYQRIHKQLRACREIARYINTTDWIYHREILVMSRQVVNTSVSETAEYYGVTRQTVRKVIQKGDHALSRKIGENILELIDDGHVLQAMYQLSMGTGMLITGLVIPNAIELIGKPAELSSVNLRNAHKELQLLRFLNIIFLEDRINELDRDTLKYLLYILTSVDDRYSKLRGIINTYLWSEEDKVYDCVSQLSDVNNWIDI